MTARLSVRNFLPHRRWLTPREREKAGSLSKIVLGVVYCRAEAVARFDPSRNRICRDTFTKYAESSQKNIQHVFNDALRS